MARGYIFPSAVSRCGAHRLSRLPAVRAALAGLIGGAAGWTAPGPALAQQAGNVTTLAPVQVTGQLQERVDLSPPAPGGQLARGSHLGLLGNTDVMDQPFSTTSYTSQFIENTQARTIADVVVNDPSVRVTTSPGGFGDDFKIRGYTLKSEDISFNGLYGLVSGNHMPVEMVERVEVLKGPGSLLYGMAPSGAVGGGINIVSKRAGAEPLTRFTATYRSPAQFGVNADVGRRFGENQEWGVRFNGVYRDGEANIDKQDQRTMVGALGVDYTGRRLRWSLDAYAQHEDLDRAPRGQVAFMPGIDIPRAPDGDTDIYPGTNLEYKDNMVATRLEYDFTDSLTAYGAIGRHESTVHQFFANGWVDADGNFSAPGFPGFFDVNSGYYDSKAVDTSGEIGLRGRFKTGPIGHAVVFSANRLHRDFSTFSGPMSHTPSSIYDPAHVPDPLGDRSSPSKAKEDTLTSYALADTLSMLDERVLLTLGARHQQVKTEGFSTATGERTSKYDEDAITPLIGLVIKPWQNVSLYANYTKGLSPGAIAPPMATNANEAFAPAKSEQYEGGIKYDQGDLMATLSVFQIKKPNSLTDPVTNVFSFDGEQRNRGIELNVYGELTPGLRVMGGATFMNAELTRTAGGVNQGNDAPGVPKRMFNLGVEWDTPWVAGLSLNARALYTGPVYYDAANDMKLPSVVRYDLGARYATQIAGRNVTFRAAIENLTDEHDWILSDNGWASITAERTFVLSTAVEF